MNTSTSKDVLKNEMEEYYLYADSCNLYDVSAPFLYPDEAHLKIPGAKNGAEIAKQNELYVLRELRHQGTIREDELAILLCWSKQMVQRTTKRLATTGTIVRTRAHGAYFVAIKKLKDTATILSTWMHDALAIQVLGQIRAQRPHAVIETEAKIRERIQKGKIPDGHLNSDWGLVRVEIEMRHKTGRPMSKQTSEALLLARQGITTVFAYFYPPSSYFKLDWERRLASSIRTELGNDEPAPYIQLMRCYIPKVTDYTHCRPIRFEVIDLPPKPEISQIGKGRKMLGTEQIQGYHWKCLTTYLESGREHKIYDLCFDNDKRGIFKFIKGHDGEEHQLYEQHMNGNWYCHNWLVEEYRWDRFNAFINASMIALEKDDVDPVFK